MFCCLVPVLPKVAFELLLRSSIVALKLDSYVEFVCAGLKPILVILLSLCTAHNLPWLHGLPHLCTPRHIELRQRNLYKCYGWFILSIFYLYPVGGANYIETRGDNGASTSTLDPLAPKSMSRRTSRRPGPSSP